MNEDLYFIREDAIIVDLIQAPVKEKKEEDIVENNLLYFG